MAIGRALRYEQTPVAGPQIPYLELPEIPLGFLTRLPDPVVGALLGGLIGAVAGSSFFAGAKNRALKNGVTVALALVGALIGYSKAPHLFDPGHPPSIKPFGTLVALGVYIGSVIAVRHAKERGLDVKRMSEFIFWVVGLGFVGGHVLDAIFYHPGRVAKDPLYLFYLWDGLSSYGGFTGALIGAVSWKLYRRQKILAYCEMVNSAFPLAWVFGRAGCSVAHDHPGRFSDGWYAVRYPHGDGVIGRFDLGLYEFLLAIPLAVSFLLLWKRKPDRRMGFYTGVMCTAYAPVRFGLDFLREVEGGISGADPRYGGLTPAQWASFGLLGIGIYFLRVAAPGAGAPARAEALEVAREPAEVPAANVGATGEEQESEERDDLEEAEAPPRERARRPRPAASPKRSAPEPTSAPPGKRKKRPVAS